MYDIPIKQSTNFEQGRDDIMEQRSVYRKKRIKKRRRIRRMKIIGIFLFLLMGSWFGIRHFTPGNAAAVSISPKELSSYPEWLREMVERNPETSVFAKDYKHREDYIGKSIDLSKECKQGEVPLLLQWDRRWGYDSYGNDVIGVAGCGPTCLSMAYIYLTGDTTKNPRVMADFSYENGYYSSEGTSWSLWTEGAAKLGLSSAEVPLDEAAMKNRLDQGQVIICSMSPGDFTTTGHFILIRGYSREGFQVNDPNRKSNSEKNWSFEKLQGQIKCLWALSY